MLATRRRVMFCWRFHETTNQCKHLRICYILWFKRFLPGWLRLHTHERSPNCLMKVKMLNLCATSCPNWTPPEWRVRQHQVMEEHREEKTGRISSEVHFSWLTMARHLHYTLLTGISDQLNTHSEIRHLTFMCIIGMNESHPNCSHHPYASHTIS